MEHTKRTAGEWTYVEGEPGFSGDFYEPPSEPYPPTIVSTLNDKRTVEIAQLVDPVPSDATYDHESGEPERTGCADANGRLMASAPELLEMLRVARGYIKDMRVPLGDPILDEIDIVIAKADNV